MLAEKTITDNIIEKIKRNRISTTEIADCMNKTGALHEVYSLNNGHFRVGPVQWVYCFNESNWELHEQIRDAKEGHVLLAEAFDCNGRALFGELVSKYLLLYRQMTAIVVNGTLRDIPHLRKENWPIWTAGITPIGCFNRKNETSFDPNIIKERRNKYNDSIAVCDDSGVVIVPKELHNQDFLEKLDRIEGQEDLWFDCIDRLKWDTFDTVCAKRYEDLNKYLDAVKEKAAPFGKEKDV
jgi:4-hydroxy-4-methyl-2-oxoglutarate aldolase